MNILGNHVLVSIAHTHSIALDNTLAADTDDTLVRAHVHGRPRGIVVLARHPASPVTVILNPGLALGGAAGADSRGWHAAAFAQGGALGAGEVPGPIDEDDAGSVVGDPLHQSISVSLGGIQCQEERTRPDWRVPAAKPEGEPVTRAQA